MWCQTFLTYQTQPPTALKAASSANLLTRAVFCVIWYNFVCRTATHDVLFLVGLTIYARYRQIVHVTEHHEVLKSLIGALNKKSLYIGFASCYGISIVANFQETNVRPMHYVGAFTAFGMGTLYFCMQSVISLRLEPYITLKKALYRSILSIICCIFFVVVAVCGVISHIGEFRVTNQLISMQSFILIWFQNLREVIRDIGIRLMAAGDGTLRRRCQNGS